ncbi:uncharacterized protein A4U43_C02F19250 [Asparagus officinalis]|uniref:Uncharacterized protein n=2 Tax=Asparagus officinalis TaxID=4686 RepID=A0A5P1FK89_ASPOF|nr:uncharacterized protein A4U43_C02F19250 [Asparagus officinalis]
MHGFERIPARWRERRVTEGTEAGGEADEPLGKYIPGHKSLRLSDLNSVLNAYRPLKRSLEAFSMVRRAQCILFTSFYELESQIIDALREQLHCPVYTIGPSIPFMHLRDNNNNIDHIQGWLNSQPKKTVLYVSLGSFLSVSVAQMDEIATGLRLSGVRFMWVARGDSSSRLQEMVGDMGIIVPWCDQLKVLNHDSIGGFLTHCGWNSTLEGVFCGVPMLTFPIFWDQPVASRLVVDEWKIGLNLRGDAGREGVVGREEIALLVKKLIDSDGDDSRDIRRRAAGLRGSARRAISAGGSSSENLDSFVRDLMKGSGC